MNKAVLNNELIAIKAGDITVYNYDGETREYISTSTEYLAVGVGIPACSCLDAPVTHKAGYAICRSADFNSWEYVPDHRGEIIYSTETGESKEITAPGDYPENTTTIAPLTPYDKWDGEKWVTDTEAQHSAAVDAAEAQRQSLIDAAMASISLIQLKLQAGRKLTQAETTRLNAVLDYIDAVTEQIPAPRRMSSGLNCRRRRPFNIWCTGCINQFQCFQIIQPQIILFQLIFFKSSQCSLTLPLSAIDKISCIRDKHLLLKVRICDFIIMSTDNLFNRRRKNRKINHASFSLRF